MIMSNECVIVCDAWRDPPKSDVEDHPHIIDENQAFGYYLDHAIDLLKPKFKIFHVASGWEIMEQMNTEGTTILEHQFDLPTDFDKYYFCGFHFGRCVHDKPLSLYEKGFELDRLGVVFNLSLLFPDDDYNSVREISKKRGASIPMYNFIPSPVGFTKDFTPYIELEGDSNG